jgi:hypothetical protein
MNLESKSSQRNGHKSHKTRPTITNLVIWTLVEDAAIVGIFLLHPILQHIVLLTFIARNEMELQLLGQGSQTGLRGEGSLVKTC